MVVRVSIIVKVTLESRLGRDEGVSHMDVGSKEGHNPGRGNNKGGSVAEAKHVMGDGGR